MCGIVGVFRPTVDPRTDPWSDGRLDRMVQFIRRRGPDQQGRWRSADGRVQFGHTRLSILDLSDAGRQPFISRSGRMVVTYNGEIYNYKRLAERLYPRGFRPRSTGDTEVLVEYIEAFGAEQFLNDADGMFAFGAFDSVTHSLTLARDRFGEKPLFWANLDGCLVFGSDLRSLGAFSPGSRAISPDAVREYLQWGYVPMEGTIWRGMNKLRAGQWLSAQVEAESLRIAPARRYFQPRSVAAAIEASRLPPPTDEQLTAALRDTVSSRMMADVPLGALLSGGIDSSLVVALMRASDRAVKTFSIGFDKAEYDEAPWAAKVARHLGTEHRELYLSDRDVIDVVPQLAGMLAEPLADSSLLPTFLVARFARNEVTVALSGDGGDELFGGYLRYSALGVIANTMRWIPTALRAPAAALCDLAAEPRWAGAVESMASLLPSRARIARPRRKLAIVAGLLRENSLRSAYEAMVLSQVPFAPPSRFAGLEPFSSHWLASARLHDTEHYLPDDICVKVDRASMAVGLELRAPFLSKDVFDLAWRYAATDLMRGGRGKLPLRRVLGRFAARELFERPKMGFGIPIQDWLRTSLSGFVRAGIDEVTASGALAAIDGNVALLEQMFREHMSGAKTWGTPLWTVAALGAWMREQRQDAQGSTALPVEAVKWSNAGPRLAT